MSETELKFLVAAADLAKFLARPPLIERTKGAKTQHIETIYFDTPGEDLWKLGFSLRIRSADGHWSQTVKQDGASLVERGEWERDIPAPANGAPPHPDRAMIARTPLAGVIDDALWTSLRPVFETDVRRTAFLWISGEAAIEVAIDRGAIRGGGATERRQAVSEIELELKQGEPAAVFALARTLAALAPLRLSLVSKAECGRRLMADAIATPAKASKPRIGDAMTMRAAFRAIGRACLHDFMLNVAALDGPDPIEAVHQGRVAIRRLRAALALVKPLTREADHATMNSKLRALARIFGAARDRDVLRASGPAAQGGEARDFSAWLEARRGAAHEAVRKAVKSKRWRMFLIDLSEWLESGAWLEPPPDDRRAMIPFVRERLRRRRGALLQRAQDLARLDRSARHKVRIEAKKLRYMAQFFASVAGVAHRKKLDRTLACLDRLQSALGDLRDAEARPAMVQAEIRLWRSAAGQVDAASLAAAERFAAPAGDDGGRLGKALKACAELARTDPFRRRRSDYRLPPESSNKQV